MELVIYILTPLYETRYSRGSDIYYNNVRQRCKAYVLVCIASKLASLLTLAVQRAEP